jgi:protein transport protein SEC24
MLTDIRTAAMSTARVLSAEVMMTYLLPRLYELHTMSAEVGQMAADGSGIVFPNRINLSGERLVRHGLYLMDCFDMLILWIGRAVPPQIIQELLDLPAAEAVPTGKVKSFTKELYEYA